MITKIREQFAALTQDMGALKAQYLAVLADKNIPLDERYQLFESAPDFMYDNCSYITDFEFECIGITWTEYGRHEQIQLGSFISSCEWSVENNSYNLLPDIEWSKIDGTVYYENHDWAKLIPMMKEELMAANCMEVTFDW